MHLESFLYILSPYRNAQEKISKAVKSFGGEGKIHGFIIDIDFYNHIMLNPVDGKMTFYFSPMFGIMKEYRTVYELLAEQNVELLERYKQQNELSSESDNIILAQGNTKGFIKIDIKNSPYSDSRRMNQLQRLFDAKLLREWDDSIMNASSNIKALEET